MAAELTTVLPAGAAAYYGASENRVHLGALAQPAVRGAAAGVMPFIGRAIRREVMVGEDVGSRRPKSFETTVRALERGKLKLSQEDALKRMPRGFEALADSSTTTL